jgi:hypothetical protein
MKTTIGDKDWGLLIAENSLLLNSFRVASPYQYPSR